MWDPLASRNLIRTAAAHLDRRPTYTYSPSPRHTPVYAKPYAKVSPQFLVLLPALFNSHTVVNLPAICFYGALWHTCGQGGQLLRRPLDATMISLMHASPGACAPQRHGTDPVPGGVCDIWNGEFGADKIGTNS